MIWTCLLLILLRVVNNCSFLILFCALTYYINVYIMALKPLSIISYPKKGIRNIRISAYTLICIDSDVFKDSEFTLYRSGYSILEIDSKEDLKLICSFLSIDIKDSYVNRLVIDSNMCSFV